jgi:chaperonin GroES
MNLRPLGDQLIVKLIEEEERTKGGIVLPDTAKERPQQGEVVAVGSGSWDENHTKRFPLEVKVGDRVVFTKYSGNEWKDDSEKYLILKESDILAVVEREPAGAKR